MSDEIEVIKFKVKQFDKLLNECENKIEFLRTKRDVINDKITQVVTEANQIWSDRHVLHKQLINRGVEL